MNKTIMAVGASVLLLFVAACDEAEPTPDPALAFCDSLEVLAESVAALDALDVNATVEDVQTDVEAVSADAADVKDAAGDLAESQYEAIESAVEELQSYTDNIDETETIEQVLQGLATQVADIKAARVEAGTVHCGLTEADAAAQEAEATIEAAASAAADEVEAAASAAATEAEAAASAAADEVEAAAEAVESATP